MTTLMTVFMVFAIMMCVFSALVITREIVRDSVERREKRSSASAPAAETQTAPEEPAAKEAEAPVAQTQPQAEEELPFYPTAEDEAEEVAATEAVETAETEPTNDEAVRFRPKTTQTLEEKYLALDQNARKYYDEIVKYAAAKEGAKRIKNVRYEEYKIGLTRLVRLLIKRGTVMCEFILPNADFKNYVNENKVDVKLAASVMKITDEAATQAAKDSVDIVVNAIAQEKEYKKQVAREKRRLARRKAKQAEEGEQA